MNALRLVAPALLAAALAAGCSKKDNDKDPPAVSAAPAAAGDVALPKGDPIKLKDLAAIVLPKPPVRPTAATGRTSATTSPMATAR